MDASRIPNEDLSCFKQDAQGAYAWDRWEERAKAAGLTPELAQLGRAVMREAVQHAWDSDLKRECGWDDQGEAMLSLAQRDPGQANRRWSHLLETDGERGYFTPQGEFRPLRRGGA